VNIIVVDPVLKSVTQVAVTGPDNACRRFLAEPWGCDDLTADHAILYCPIGYIEPEPRFAWSKRMGELYAGNVLVFGRAVDGALQGIGRGMERAVEDDFVFLGGPTTAAIAVRAMAKASARQDTSDF
jgi:hypothetical protein